MNTQVKSVCFSTPGTTPTCFVPNASVSSMSDQLDHLTLSQGDRFDNFSLAPAANNSHRTIREFLSQAHAVRKPPIDGFVATYPYPLDGISVSVEGSGDLASPPDMSLMVGGGEGFEDYKIEGGKLLVTQPTIHDMQLATRAQLAILSQQANTLFQKTSDIPPEAILALSPDECAQILVAGRASMALSENFASLAILEEPSRYREFVDAVRPEFTIGGTPSPFKTGLENYLHNIKNYPQLVDALKRAGENESQQATARAQYLKPDLTALLGDLFEHTTCDRDSLEIEQPSSDLDFFPRFQQIALGETIGLQAAFISGLIPLTPIAILSPRATAFLGSPIGRGLASAIACYGYNLFYGDSHSAHANVWAGFVTGLEQSLYSKALSYLPRLGPKFPLRPLEPLNRSDFQTILTKSPLRSLVSFACHSKTFVDLGWKGSIAQLVKNTFATLISAQTSSLTAPSSVPEEFVPTPMPSTPLRAPLKNQVISI